MITFEEDGMICEVDVLEDTSDKDWDRYKLRVNKVIRNSPLSSLKPPVVGEEFSVDQRRNIGVWGGMWRLVGYTKGACVNG